jgi:hypothetical protein
MPFAVCIEHSRHVQNNMETEIHLMINREVIAVYCENTPIQCTAKKKQFPIVTACGMCSSRISPLQ